MLNLAVGQIFLNQVGYLPPAAKILWTTETADSFRIESLTGQNVVFRGPLVPTGQTDPATGLNLAYGDFSALQTPGLFRAIISGNLASDTIKIAADVYLPLLNGSLKMFYFQRCGMLLQGSNAGPYYHPECHTLDATFHGTSGHSGFKITTGGWHDAGDFGKYVVNAAVSVGTLLMAREWFPESLNGDDLNIPESGNGVPDVLDECRYELEWMLTMQGTDGGVFHKLTPELFAPFMMPQYDQSPRFIYQKSSTATAGFAAVMARAARLYAEFDAGFAAACLNAASAAWGYLMANPSIVPPGGFHNPPGTNTGEYGDGDDRDERLWAAIELFETTGDAAYLNYFLNHYAALGLITGEMFWANVKTTALLAYLKSSRIPENDPVKVLIRNSLLVTSQSLISNGGDNGFGVVLEPGDYYWGSNSIVLNRTMLLVMDYLENQNPQNLAWASRQLDYLLGCNAHGLSFVTGFGQHYPMHPHHRASQCDPVAEPVPGMLVGGPDEYLDDPVLQGLFNSATPPALCYADDVGSYASNEIAINWNAPLVFLLAALQTQMGPTALPERPVGSVSREFVLFPGYPNPFNSETVITYQIFKGGMVREAVFNILGQKVWWRSAGYQPAGVYTRRLNFDRIARKELPSGLYLYRLTVNGVSRHSKHFLMR